MKTICCILFLAVAVNAATYTVKSGGGGNYTTIQACATAMAPGDTCVVWDPLESTCRHASLSIL